MVRVEPIAHGVHSHPIGMHTKRCERLAQLVAADVQRLPISLEDAPARVPDGGRVARVHLVGGRRAPRGEVARGADEGEGGARGKDDGECVATEDHLYVAGDGVSEQIDQLDSEAGEPAEKRVLARTDGRARGARDFAVEAGAKAHSSPHIGPRGDDLPRRE